MADAGKMTFEIPLSRLIVTALAAGLFLGCNPQERVFGEPASSGGGSGDGGSNSGGSGGSGGKGGSGGNLGGSGGNVGGSGGGNMVCTPGEPACDDQRATTCSEDGTAFEAGGTECEGNTECKDGACVEKPCTAGELFCSGKELRKCADDGLGSAVEATCGDDEYCNGTDKACAAQVCSPKTKQCGTGAQPQVCADDGSGWENDGEACGGDNPICKQGSCVCVPDTQRCSPSGEQPQVCTNDNAWIGKEEPCTGAMYSGCRKLGTGTNVRAQCVATTVPVSYGDWNRVVGTNTSKTYTDNFRLDKYEVTVGQFRRFVDAYIAGYRPKQGDGKHTHLHAGSGLKDGGPAGGYELGWDETWAVNLPTTLSAWTKQVTETNAPSKFAVWTSSVGDNESYPMNLISWYEAYAYCIWDGGFLPTEAEWEWAARNGLEARKYPWPGDLTLGNNTDLAVWGCWLNGANGNCIGIEQISKVDEGPALLEHSKWAHIAGNVWEWTLDYHVGTDASPPVYPADCTNCATLSIPNTQTRLFKTHRGGDFYWGKEDLETSAHRNFDINWRDHYGGVRCARTSGQF